MITVVALSPSVDVTYVVDEFELGEVHRPDSVHRVAGGKSLNAARAAAAMGADVSAIAVLWGVAGEHLAQELAAAGVELTRIGGSVETRTCISIASMADGRMTEIYERATPVSSSEWGSVTEAALRVLPRRPGWLAVSGSVPSSLGAGALARLVELGADAGVSVAIDSHGPPLGPAVDAGPALVKVNRAEAAALLGRDSGVDVFELATGIHERSGGIAVVTDGIDGSVVTDGRESWRVSPSEAIGNFPVGSGDSFLGGMLSALDGGTDVAGALRLGAGCATANALEPGAARFDPQRARSIAAALTVERAR